MRKPIDPHKHGLKKPERFVRSRTETLRFESDAFSRGPASIPLMVAIGLWNKAWKDHESQGHKLVSGPDITPGNYGRMQIEYSYEWENLKYDEEKAEYDQAVSLYQADCAAYEEYLKAREAKDSDSTAKSIELQIERAKQRLANLEAVKAGEPIPYP